MQQQRQPCPERDTQNPDRILGATPAQGGKALSIRKSFAIRPDKWQTPAQIVIRCIWIAAWWVIPKSVTPSRIAGNFDVWDFRLDKDELGEIAKLDQGKRLGPDPDQFGG